MSDDDELRVPPVLDPEKTRKAHHAIEHMKAERALAISTLRKVAEQEVTDTLARQAQYAAIFLLQNQLDVLTEAFETVTGKREPSAAERASR